MDERLLLLVEEGKVKDIKKKNETNWKPFKIWILCFYVSSLIISLVITMVISIVLGETKKKRFVILFLWKFNLIESWRALVCNNFWCCFHKVVINFKSFCFTIILNRLH
jgi:hypothetical protein